MRCFVFPTISLTLLSSQTLLVELHFLGWVIGLAGSLHLGYFSWSTNSLDFSRGTPQIVVALAAFVLAYPADLFGSKKVDMIFSHLFWTNWLPIISLTNQFEPFDTIYRRSDRHEWQAHVGCAGRDCDSTLCSGIFIKNTQNDHPSAIAKIAIVTSMNICPKIPLLVEVVWVSLS